jgi:RecA-family ATPase
VTRARLPNRRACESFTFECGGQPSPFKPNPEDQPESGTQDEFGASKEQPQPPRKLVLLDPADWEGKPLTDRAWIALNMIPALEPNLFIGDGGTGKSTAAVQLAVARTLQRDWMGIVPSMGRTLYLSAEDDEPELHRRVDACLKHYGGSYSDLRDRIKFIDLVGDDAVLGVQQNGTIKATDLYRAVSEAIAGYSECDFVILDSLADIFAGDENNRTQARQFVGLLKILCRRHHCAITALSHPSLSGMASGSGTSGSTAWSNSVRSRLYLEYMKSDDKDDIPDPDVRLLSTKKINYARKSEVPITLRYKNGVYVPEGSVSGLNKLGFEHKAEQVFKSILRMKIDQGIDFSAKKGPSYAPPAFAKEEKAMGFKKQHLEKAMLRLLDRVEIRLDTFGPPSKQRTRLVFT